MINPLKLSQRLLFFIFIGAGSALVHVLSVLGFVSYLLLRPLIANIFAFFLAFNISFLGHKYLTFSKLNDQKQLRLPHFFLVASSAGIINELLYFLVLNYTQLNFLIGLILVLGCVSIYSFILSRCWACR